MRRRSELRAWSFTQNHWGRVPRSRPALALVTGDIVVVVDADARVRPVRVRAAAGADPRRRRGRRLRVALRRDDATGSTPLGSPRRSDPDDGLERPHQRRPDRRHDVVPGLPRRRRAWGDPARGRLRDRRRARGAVRDPSVSDLRGPCVTSHAASGLGRYPLVRGPRATSR